MSINSGAKKIRILLSAFTIVGCVLLWLFFVGVVILYGVLNAWEGMLLYYLALIFIAFFIYDFCKCGCSVITIKDTKIISKIPLFATCEIDCEKLVYYIYFQDEIETKKRRKNYIMLSHNDLSRLSEEKRTAWKYDIKTQIVLPYTKETEPLLQQWLNGEQWIYSGGALADLDVPPPSPPPPPPPPPTRPSKESADEYNKSFRNY